MVQGTPSSPSLQWEGETASCIMNGMSSILLLRCILNYLLTSLLHSSPPWLSSTHLSLLLSSTLSHLFMNHLSSITSLQHKKNKNNFKLMALLQNHPLFTHARIIIIYKQNNMWKKSGSNIFLTDIIFMPWEPIMYFIMAFFLHHASDDVSVDSIGN